LNGPWFQSCPFELKAKRLSPGGFFFPTPHKWSESGLATEPLKGTVEIAIYGSGVLAHDVQVFSLATLKKLSEIN
jgi:hypothetical protein